MVFGLFKKPTFEDHIKRLEGKLWDAHKNMFNTDCVMCGVNPTGDQMTLEPDWVTPEQRVATANRYKKKCVRCLDEAMYLAEKAIETSAHDQSKLNQIIDAIEEETFVNEADGGDVTIYSEAGFSFKTSAVRDLWVSGFCQQWVKQFHEMLPSNFNREVKINLKD